MQFDLSATDDSEDATEAVAPGTSCTIGTCGSVDPYKCTCPGCGGP